MDKKTWKNRMAGNTRALQEGMLDLEWLNKWAVWLCQEQKSCSVHGALCFTYSEVHGLFVPWGYKRELDLVRDR